MPTESGKGQTESDRAVGISFLKAAILKLSELWNAPWLVFRSDVQAKKATVAEAGLSWGYPGMNFKAKLPFYEMR